MANDSQGSEPAASQTAREEAIFNGAKVLPLSERPAYLRAACGQDASLRIRIEALLRSHEQAGDFLEAGATSPKAMGTIIVAAPPSEKPGDCIGNYKIRE